MTDTVTKTRSCDPFCSSDSVYSASASFSSSLLPSFPRQRSSITVYDTKGSNITATPCSVLLPSPPSQLTYGVNQSTRSKLSSLPVAPCTQHPNSPYIDSCHRGHDGLFATCPNHQIFFQLPSLPSFKRTVEGKNVSAWPGRASGSCLIGWISRWKVLQATVTIRRSRS